MVKWTEVEIEQAIELFECEKKPHQRWGDDPNVRVLGAPTAQSLSDEERHVYLARARKQLQNE